MHHLLDYSFLHRIIKPLLQPLSQQKEKKHVAVYQLTFPRKTRIRVFWARTELPGSFDLIPCSKQC